MITFHELKDYAIGTLAVCSTLHSILPPWDWEPEFVTVGLQDFPRAQKLFLSFFRNRWYKLAIYLIGFVAVNIRSTLWKRSISMPVQFQKMQANGG